MLEKYFSAPKTLARLRAGLSGPHIDGFADALEREGYSHGAALRYLRAAAHLGQFQRLRHATLADIDGSALDDFGRHLRRCRCPLSNGGKVNHHVFFGAKRFHAYLFQTGVSQARSHRGKADRGTGADRFFPRLVSKAPWCNRANASTLLP